MNLILKNNSERLLKATRNIISKSTLLVSYQLSKWKLYVVAFRVIQLMYAQMWIYVTPNELTCYTEQDPIRVVDC